MKTKHLFGLVAVVAVGGFAASAQAGLSVDFVFGLPVPVVRSAPVYVPPCPLPVVACAPVVVHRPAPPVCRPVVYAAPRYERHYDYRNYRGHDRYRDERGRAYASHGHGYGGRR